ncbi:hypothetical protein M407DRAFT_245550 [Tulasnella calospora MUT 4182]|uniref:Uncharacterized protein n=1 Tax=Tulasnella calospora MUT 4182 TaxID=1051891 RepID=A0A0C3Q018_9AGAM|nr:hypothetical protein M407DRAFT_245550 [Tulasnella calospora MUT 4182]
MRRCTAGQELRVPGNHRAVQKRFHPTNAKVFGCNRIRLNLKVLNVAKVPQVPFDVCNWCKGDMGVTRIA